MKTLKNPESIAFEKEYKHCLSETRPDLNPWEDVDRSHKSEVFDRCATRPANESPFKRESDDAYNGGERSLLRKMGLIK